MAARTTVTFQLNMGPPSTGSIRTGSLAELYGFFFSRGHGYIPPLDVLNDKLATGIDHAYEHGFHLRWMPLQVTPAEYLLFCQDLRGKKYMEEVNAPSNIRTWDEWLQWIDSRPTLSRPDLSLVASPSGEELALRKKYRKALAMGDASTAEALAAEIRQRFDPSFS